jgi:hypothetical protein
MCAVVFKKNIQISENQADKNYLDLCKSIVDDNKIWLNKNNYKKYLKTNNKSIFATIKNIIKQIKEQDKDNQGEMINLSIIINYMKNYSKYKIDVIKENIFKKMINEKIVIDNNKNFVTEESVKNYEETELIKPSEPYLPEIKNRKFTLVLDLDETLVHYVEEEDSAYIQIRPGAENFLEEMHEYYEIIIFTAAMQDVIIFF